jgi:hypothetical protein
MAKLNPDFSFTGRLGNISAYRMKGSDQTILRTRGGASKDKIKHDPRFEKQRRVNVEFGGRGTATKCLRKALFPLPQLADYNFTSSLNALTNPIQELDTISEFGKRNIYFSKNPQLLEGFNLNRRNTFDSIVRNPLSYELNKDALIAQINFPALLPGINFFVPPGNHPAFSFVAVIGLVPDLVVSVKSYTPLNDACSGYVTSEWFPVMNGSPAVVLEPNLTKLLSWQTLVSPFTVMLSVGIRFGTMAMNNDIAQVKHAGAAKILAMR